MVTAEEFLDREAASWEAFEAQVERVPVDRRDEAGVVEGWSLKDVVWHCAYWSRFAADHVVMDGDGPFTDPFDAHDDAYWDGVNAQVADASAAMSWEDVWQGMADARSSVRAAISRQGLAPDRIGWAADESWIHYDEHAGHVRVFADALG